MRVADPSERIDQVVMIVRTILREASRRAKRGIAADGGVGQAVIVWDGRIVKTPFSGVNWMVWFDSCMRGWRRRSLLSLDSLTCEASKV